MNRLTAVIMAASAESIHKPGECEKKIEMYGKLMYTISTCAVSEDRDQSESLF